MAEESKVVQLVCADCGEFSSSSASAVEDPQVLGPCPECGGARQIAGLVDERRSGVDRRDKQDVGARSRAKRSWSDRREA